MYAMIPEMLLVYATYTLFTRQQNVQKKKTMKKINIYFFLFFMILAN